MNKMKYSALLLLAALVTGVSAFGQTRYTDLEIVQVTSPANNAVIANGDSASITIRVKNNGKDTLRIAVDTYYVYGSLMGIAQNAPVAGYIAPGANAQAMPPNSQSDWSFQYTTSGGQVLAKLPNNRTANTDTTMNLCISIISKNQLPGGVINTNGKYYNDTLPANNTNKCVSITFKGKPKPNSIDDLNTERNALALFPNPANRFVTLRTEAQTRNARVHVTDMTGRVLLQHTFDKPASDVLQLDISSLAAGIYIVNLQTDKSNKTGKLVVRH
ncbi:putative secreted protein (Por secretion system target) [Taibaiella chishuiensis]|uniref:Putative secreted protein (Por secretion system target) n=2 Tax=Taibaiella chishuiensis TaxID=1434707 RepID=A0A2P8CSQ4_9BACT|nr:putative secreted protein (Por secretion system target) [Taibaiella chishuiensis]